VARGIIVQTESIGGLLTATLIGAAIGLERQWSGHATGPHARFGGIRTLSLLGAVAGVAGSLAGGPLWPFAVAILSAAALVVVAGYVAASRVDVDATTEVAALMVLASGLIAGMGRLALASALAAGTVLLLLEKTRLHALVAQIDDASLRASARFAAMACIILPLLPAGPYGPFEAIRPRELWAVVLFLSGLSFLGWIARRLTGPQRGPVIAGLLGGIISSTSVTLQFARSSREPGAQQVALAAGAIGACTVMLARVTLVSAVLNPALAVPVLRHTVLPFLLGAAVLFAVWRMDEQNTAAEPSKDSPLQLRAALQMTAIFQVVLLAIAAVRAYAGSGALVATSVFVGMTDLDALTISLARDSARESGAPDAVVVALVAGIISNTVVKLGIALVVGQARFRLMTVAVLAGLAVTLLASLWLQ
jgi:uncharacterized membrane protein (DUF4010 family)